MIRMVLTVLLTIGLAACGDDGEGSGAVLPRGTPAPGSRIVYRLDAGSTIARSAIRRDNEPWTPPRIEPIEGTFVATVAERRPPNTARLYHLSDISFHGTTFTFVGDSGVFVVSTFYPYQLDGGFSGSLDSVSVVFSGLNLLSSSTNPPVFRALEFCARAPGGPIGLLSCQNIREEIIEGFILYIHATPVEW